MAATNGEKRFEDLKEDFERLEEKVDGLQIELNKDDKETALDIQELRGIIKTLATKSDITKLKEELNEETKKRLENTWRTKLLWGMVIGGASLAAGTAAYLVPDIQLGMTAVGG